MFLIYFYIIIQYIFPTFIFQFFPSINIISRILIIQ